MYHGSPTGSTSNVNASRVRRLVRRIWGVLLVVWAYAVSGGAARTRDVEGNSAQASDHGISTTDSEYTSGDVTLLSEVARHSEFVNFGHVTQAWLGSRHAGDSEIRQKLADLLPKLVEAFTKHRGAIQRHHFYRHIGAGVALTDVHLSLRRPTLGHRWRPAIHVESVSSEEPPPRARHLILGALDLHNRALLHLARPPRRVLILRLYNIVEAVLNHLDVARRDSNQADKEQYDSLERELEQAKEYYQGSVQRGAQLIYFTGTVAALVPCLAATLYLVIPGLELFVLTEDEELLAASTLAGAAGAAVSVMTRLTGEKGLHLVGLEEASHLLLFTFGALRLLIGATFGALVFLFIFSTLLDIRVPADDPTVRLYFLIVLGFIAGFSERFAQDALAGAQSALGQGGLVPQSPPQQGPTERIPP
jgi:hypothetical protein